MSGQENILATRSIVDGNLRYTSSGYWADYLVQPRQYGSKSTREKKLVGHDHEQLFKVLSKRNALYCGTLTPETARSITAKSLNGRHADDVPWFSEITAERVHELAHDPFFWPKEQILRISVPVGKTRELAHRNRAKLLEAIPRSWELTPAEPEDMSWLWSSSIHRGVLLMPRPELDGNSAVFDPALFDDGAKEDDIDGFTAHNRPPIIKITPKGGAPSYQAVLKVNFPDKRMEFPGGTEIFSVLARTGLHVDWAIRTWHKSRRQVAAENTEAAKKIDSNRYETALETQLLDENDTADRLVSEYTAKIIETNSDSVGFIVLFALGARSYTDLERGVTFLTEVFAHMEITFERIAGLQTEMWAAMMPGTPTTERIRELADETTIAEFAELVPFTTSSVGTPTGPIRGRCEDSGFSDLFRLDPHLLLERDLPSSIALAGGLGSGKSTFMKAFSEDAAALGDLIWAYDRTDKGEWATFMRQIPGHVIVDLLNPDHSIDPLQTFRDNPRLASRHTLSALVPLLKFEVGSDEALALTEALAPDNITAQEITSQARLADYLYATKGNSHEDEAARRVGRHLKAWGSYEFARALMDPSLPPLDYSAPAICLQTYGLPAATPEKIYNEHLFKRLRPEELYVESAYELTGLAMREHYFRSPKHCVINFDEAYHITSKPVGREMLELLSHDSRKHGVSMLLGSHLGLADYDMESLKLIGIFLVGRIDKDQAAIDNLTWGGMHPEDNSHFVDDLTTRFGSGDFIVNFFGQISHVRMFQSTSATIRTAANTTFKAAS